MAKFRTIKNSFLGGELSPTALGRTDAPFYPHSCKTLQNMIPLLSGGAYRRPGTRYATRIDANTYYAPIVIPWLGPVAASAINGFTTTYTVCLLFYMDKSFNPKLSVIDSNGNVTAVSPGFSFPTNMAAAALQEYQNADVLSLTQWIQSGDTLYLCNPCFQPLKILNTNGTFTILSWNDSLTLGALRDSHPFMASNTTATTMTISAVAVGTGRTLTASASFFDSGHVGALFNCKDAGGTWGTAKVTAYTSATAVTADVIVAFGSLNPTTNWQESAWSIYRGWPAACAIFENRLGFAGTSFKRDDIFLSQTGNYQVFSSSGQSTGTSTPTKSPYVDTSMATDDPFTIQLPQKEVARIQTMYGGKLLFVGSRKREYLIQPGVDSAGNPVFGIYGAAAAGTSPYSFKVSNESAVGLGPFQGIRQNDELLFVDRSLTKVRDFVFYFTEQTYQAEQVQATFEHYPKPDAQGTNTDIRRFQRISWDQSRATLWCSDTAGNLFSVTRDRKLGINTWASHVLGGFDSTVSGTDGTAGTSSIYSNPTGSVVDIAVVEAPGAGDNHVWLVVKRKVNGSWYYYVERFIGQHTYEATAYKVYRSGLGHDFLDCLKVVQATTDGVYPNTDIMTGLTHLEGLAVKANVMNTHGVFPVNCNTVNGGKTQFVGHPSSLETEASNVAVGLNFSSIVEPVRLEAGSQVGTAQGALKRINRTFIRFFKSMSCKVGRDASHVKAIDFKAPHLAMNLSADLYTGDFESEYEGDYDRDGTIYILQDQPLPFCVVSVVAEGQTYDG